MSEKYGNTSDPLTIEYCGVEAARTMFGLGRSTLYLIIREQPQISKSVRRRGYKRGKRLIKVVALREYLDGFDSGFEECGQQPV